MAIEYPTLGPLTQGTIFSCAIAEDYLGCESYGLIISARCDVSNDKIKTYNYLPVVRLNDWLNQEGRLIFAERLLRQIEGQLRACISDSGFSVSILETERPRAVLETLYPAPSTIKAKLAQQRDRFAKLCERYDLANEALLSTPDQQYCAKLAKDSPRMRDGLLDELCHQRLAGHYFLNAVEPAGDDNGYVVLLREVRHVPRELAAAIASGLDQARYDELCDRWPSFRNRLYLDRLGYSMPLGILSSPNLEHLMQCFGLLFGRIGIQDPVPEYLAALWDRQPSTRLLP